MALLLLLLLLRFYPQNLTKKGRPAALLVHFPLPLSLILSLRPYRRRSQENPGRVSNYSPFIIPRRLFSQGFYSPEKSTVHYASISDAIAMIKSIGRGSYMSKIDIKSAFRIIPIHPDDYPLLSLKWNNSYFFDRCLPMGCSSSCAIFEAFSTSLEWLAKHCLLYTSPSPRDA